MKSKLGHRRPTSSRRHRLTPLYVLLLIVVLLLPLWAAAAAQIWPARSDHRAPAQGTSWPKSGQLPLEPPHRIHIIPNSDGPMDQAVKLLARQAVENYLDQHNFAHGDYPGPGLELWLQRRSTELAAAVQGAITDGSFGPPPKVQVQVGRFWFDHRSLGGFAVPAGVHPATRVVLGAGAGRNWWCAVFNGLCIASTWDAEAVEQQLAVAAAARHDPVQSLRHGEEEPPSPKLEVSYHWLAREWWLQQRASQKVEDKAAAFWRNWLPPSVTGATYKN